MKLYPSWRVNLLVFASLLIIVGGYFYYQTGKATYEFQKHSEDHSKVLAAVVELNIRNAMLAKDGLEDIVSRSLENSGRFIYYLDSVKSFTSPELTAFAFESGLAGVKIISSGGAKGVSGPDGWLPGEGCSEKGGLRHLAAERIYLYSFFQQEDDVNSTCVLVGLPAERIEETLAEISVQRLLSMFNDLHDIAYVRLEPDIGRQKRIVSDEVMETLLPMGDEQLVVALKTAHFARRRAWMQREFILFLGLLVVFGAFSSWWLYRIQQQRLQQTRDFEKKMARQHEDAALGRAAATITHELRNPLNAIGMGLQRLQIESRSLDNDHLELIASMRESVQRSNTIITRLKQYSDTFSVSRESVKLAELLAEVVILYHPQCQAQMIVIELHCDESLSVRGDRVLLAQLFENLIKNSVEAQPDGGYVNISVRPDGRFCVVDIVNGGFHLSEEDSRFLLEPYFTSKPRGTGLGLVISNKIVQAHGGDLVYRVDIEKQTIHFFIRLPSVGS